MSGQFTEREWRDLVALLQRYAEAGLDQWAAWRLDTEYGPVFVRIDRRPPTEQRPSSR